MDIAAGGGKKASTIAPRTTRITRSTTAAAAAAAKDKKVHNGYCIMVILYGCCKNIFPINSVVKRLLTGLNDAM